MTLKAGRHVSATLLAIVTLIASLGNFVEAQKSDPKTYSLQGTVTEVDAKRKQVGIANEPIPGVMGAMTMSYSVANPEMLLKVKPGDHVTAKIQEGDMTLYDLQVIHATVIAQDTADAGMDMEELERIALANNPTIAQAEANLRISAGIAQQAGLYPNPTVGYYGDEIRGGYYGGGKQGGFVSQTIVTGGKLRAARHVAELVTRESQTIGELQRLRILNNVRMSFYEVLGAQRLVEVRENLAKLAADATQTSNQLANIGQADRPDVLQAEVERQQADVSLRVARQNLRALWRTLAAIAGKPDLSFRHLRGDLEAIPDLDYDQWLATTLRDSPEVRLAEQSVERAEASLVQVKKARIPDLQLYGNLSQNYEPLDTTHKPTGLTGGVQIGVELPIFNRNQGNVTAAKSEIESAKQEVVRMRLQITRDLASLFREYDDARVTAQQYKTEMLPRAEQAYRLYLGNYRNMAAAYPQALISQRTLFQLEVDYVQALERVLQSSVNIEGFGLTNGLSMAVSASRAAR